jgi:signal transduction histidine kinase
MPACLPTATAMGLAAVPENLAEISRGEGERFLLQAFRTFAEAAESLERSYGTLRSEVARLRGELEQSNEGLERSLAREQALAEMAAILAHEIRNPLGSLELFAGLLAGAGLSAECREWVEQVQTGLRTLAATVNNVLHFHEPPAPQRAPTDLGALLDWAGGFLLPMARQARVELCLRNHLHGAWFAADRHRLEQVLLNLTLNALRAMPGGGSVEISGHRIFQGDAVAAEITVNDTGPGVPSRDAARIFDPGFSTRSGSPGLGLAVCRKIVEQHGGTLRAANRAGVGATFTVALPLPDQEPSSAEFGENGRGGREENQMQSYAREG